MVAQEIARLKKVKKVILLSSIKSEKENPLHFTLIKPLRLHYFFNKEVTIATVKFWGKYFGYEQGEEQLLLKSMIGKHSNHFLRWALERVSEWKEPGIGSATSIFQIHGTKDKNFPIRLIKAPDRVVKRGGHFMVYNRAAEISEIIKVELSKSE